MAHPKVVYTSYAPEDKEIALQFHEVVTTCIGNEVWIKDFDLYAGELIANIIDSVISDAKWFVLFISKHSLNSPWIKKELNATTLLSMNRNDFRIIGIKIDDCSLPLQLESIFGDQIIDISKRINDSEGEFFKLAELIEKTITTHSQESIYVDRGSDGDRFSLVSRRNKMIFVLGLAGIGKTLFIKKSVSDKLRKRPLTIELTRGHSEDLLARQLIRESRNKQPEQNISKEALLEIALDAVSQRANDFFIFIDNTEEGLDASNELLPYMERFLERFIKRNIKTHVIMATSRKPEYSVSIASETDIFKLSEIEDLYIKEYLDLLLEDADMRIEQIEASYIDEMISLIGGYPLAAKIVASQIKLGQRTSSEKTRNRIQLSLAQYILRSINQDQLEEIHDLMLKVLAHVKEPMSVEDMLSISDLNKFTIEEVNEARLKLVEIFIVEIKGELMYMHRFLVNYFQDQLARDHNKMNKFSREFGIYAYRKAVELNNDVKKDVQVLEPSDQRILNKMNEVFKYAVPASRLLRSVGIDDLAEKLPIQVEGTLREMVFYFYQTERDYDKALAYAEKWLKLNPDDLEIMLYQARCYRTKRNSSYLKRASKIIRELEKRDYKKRFTARIYREKAMLAEFDGDLEGAKSLYRQGIEVYSSHPYPENYIGLAQLLLREIDDNPYVSEDDIKRNAIEAKRLLEEARRRSTRFDDLHLGLYAEALIQTGEEDRALPLLEEALEDNPDNIRLNSRIAEVLRKKEMYKEAKIYAEKARRLGSVQAILTLVNILYSETLSMNNESQKENHLKAALSALQDYQPRNERDSQVVSTIAAKIYRGLGDWYNVRKSISPYVNSKNPYAVYEASWADYAESMENYNNNNIGRSLELIDICINRICEYKISHYLSQPMSELLDNATKSKDNILSLIQ